MLLALYKTLMYFSLFQPNVITEFSGTILDKSNNEAIQNVYVYTIKGEEETLSAAKGNFSLISWQALPVTVYFEKKGYKTKRIQLLKEQKNTKILMETY